MAERSAPAPSFTARLRGWSSRPSALLAVPLALAALAYARVLHGEFQLDDLDTVERHLAVKDLGGYVRDHLLQELGQRPVTDLTFALDYAVAGLRPFAFHLTNLAIHLAAVVLVFAFTRAVLRLAGAARAEWVALAVAALFALHPIQSEAVSYVSQRSESLASALYVATLLLVLAAERRGLTRRAAPLWSAAFACFAVALGAKMIAATLPVAWLLLAAVVPEPGRRSELLTWRRRALAVAPFLAIDLLLVKRAIGSTAGSAHAGFSIPAVTPPSYLLTQLRVVVVYLRLLLWPSGQNVDWQFPMSRGADGAVVAAGLFLLALAGGAAALAVAARRRTGPGPAAQRAAAYGVLWFFLVLSVTSSFVPLLDALVEHRLYLAAWGIFTAVALGAERLLARLPARRAAIAAAAILAVSWAASATLLFRRNAVWETKRALWENALAGTPCSTRAHVGLGFALRKEQRYAEAIEVYRKGLACAGGDLAMETQLRRNLGVALLWVRRYAEAVQVLAEADARNPDDPEILYNLVMARLATGELALAHGHAARAVALYPQNGYAWNALGSVQLAEGDLAAARASFERAVALDPDAGARSYNLGRVLERQGEQGRACAAFRRALDARLEPATREEVARAVATRCGAAAPPSP